MGLDRLIDSLGRVVRNAFGGNELATSLGEISNPNARPTSLSQNETAEILFRDGRYVAGGYSWSSRAQAEHFLQRTQPSRRTLDTQAHRRLADPAPAIDAPRVSSSRQLREVERGIWEDADGRFHAAGLSFSTVEQARFHAAKQWGGAVTNSPRSQEREPRAHEQIRFSRTGPPEATPIRGQPERWIGTPTLIRVNGVDFVAELTYVGVPKNKHGYPHNNALIDPNLSVGHDGDPSGVTLGYWPEYATLNARARRTYLEWLAAGRSDPRTPIGYVFVYFYGLERRLIYDRSDAEAEAILAEVERLLGIYGSNHAFSRYATALINFAQPLLDLPDASLVPKLERTYDFELPLGVRVSLGRLLEAKQPLDANQALCWLLLLPDTYRRTPAERCFEELKAIWKIRFAEAYPEGLRIRAPKTHIKIHYRPAAHGYYADAEVPLPDIGQVAAPIPRLRELLSSCTDELDALSRFLGRRPDARDSLEACLLLPPALRNGGFGAGTQKCVEKLDRMFGAANQILLNASEVISMLEIDRPAGPALPAALVRQIGTMLDALNIGFEPDRRYGPGGALATDTGLCLFRADAGGPVASNVDRYVAARTLTEIAALAATADGVVVTQEVAAIQRDLRALSLSNPEHRRLSAHAEAILRNPPKANAAIKRLLELPAVDRRRISQSAVSAVLADGRVLPAEVRFLEGLFRSLGLPKEDVYAQLHRGAVEDDEPVSISAAVTEAGVALPPKGEQALSVDATRLERLRRETSEVSSLLAGIFVDDGGAGPATAWGQDAARRDSRFSGLDGAHADLLAYLLSAPLERLEFEEAARTRSLLPDGALETINDWSFEQFGEPAIEAEDLILIAEHLHEPIRALEKVNQ